VHEAIQRGQASEQRATVHLMGLRRLLNEVQRSDNIIFPIGGGLKWSSLRRTCSMSRVEEQKQSDHAMKDHLVIFGCPLW